MTTETKHTPGPWKVESGSIEAKFKGHTLQVALMARTEFCGELSEQEKAVAKAFRATKEHDARLISAAPELLEALNGLYEDTAEYIRINHLGGMDNHWMVKARAALAKATGKE